VVAALLVATTRLDWIAVAAGLALWVAVLVYARRAWRGVFGTAAGLGVVALGVALAHRHNGDVCWHTVNEGGCDHTLDWHLWLPIGLVLTATGIGGHLLWNREDRPPPAG
jgi:hypothetical protein